jgi:hypothetical protein
MSNAFVAISPLFTWTDRAAVYTHLCNNKPSIPLILMFAMENRRDMSVHRWRKLNGVLDLPDEMAYGLLAAVIEPRRQRLHWPKKKSQASIVPLPFAHDDLYWRVIAENDMNVRNEIRLLNDELPKWMKKTMERDVWDKK